MIVLGHNELDFSTVFELLSRKKIRYAAVELPRPKTYEECAGNLKKSFEYLVKNY